MPDVTDCGVHKASVDFLNHRHKFAILTRRLSNILFTRLKLRVLISVRSKPFVICIEAYIMVQFLYFNAPNLYNVQDFDCPNSETGSHLNKN